MKHVFGVIVVSLLATAAGSRMFAQGADADTTVDPAKMKQLQRMATAVNLNDMILSKFKEGIQESMKAESSGMPDEFMNGFVDQLVERFDVDEFIQQVIAPVLDPYFTVDELSMIADFLESDFGKRLVTAKMNGEEIDVEKMMTDGEISEQDGMKMMQLFLRLGKKKDLLENGNIQNEIEERGKMYGQALAMDVLSQMMEEYSEGSDGDTTEEVAK